MMNEKYKYLAISIIIILVLSALVTAVLYNGEMQNIPGDNDYFEKKYSFENDMQGWKKNGTDLDNPPINWSINRSNEMSTNGYYSVRFYLENYNDAGKIWIEKTFDVEPNSIYEVKISYKFATADFGDVNLFNIINTVLGDSFDGRDNLNYEGDTGHHSDARDFVWLDKEYDYVVETDENAQIYINIGVWGSWETTRTYYLDELNISLEKLEPIDEYPDISGVWNLKNYNWKGNLTSEENVTIVQDGGDVEIQFELGMNTQGMIIKNNIDNPYKNTDFVIKGCDFRGLGINVIYIINESYMVTEIPLCESCNPSVFLR